jgi:hypothetical protein
MNAPRVSSSLALAAFAETWISGVKVVVFGDASSPLPERLLERGARHVQVYDRDPARVAEATAEGRSSQISYSSLDQAGSTLRDGVFDFGIIEDLASAEREPELLLQPLARALSRRGMALIAARNPDVTQRLIPCSVETEQPIGYYDLYDTVSQHFQEVRMLGQTAFVGYAVADFSATDDTEVRIDTAFLPSGAEEPEWFLALASALPVSAASFSVIQIPFGDLRLPAAQEQQPDALELAERAEEQAERARRAKAEQVAQAAQAAQAEEQARRAQEQAKRAQEQSERAQQNLKQAEAKASELEAALQKQKQRSDARILELEAAFEKLKSQQARDSSREHKTQVLALQAELASREEWLTGLEARASTADQRADEMQSELDQLTADNARAKLELTRAQQRLDEELRAKKALEDGSRVLKQELDKLRKALDGDTRKASKLEQELKLELDKLQKSTEGDTRRASKLEQELKLELDKLRKAAGGETQRASRLEQELRLELDQLRKATGGETQRASKLEQELEQLREAAEGEAQRAGKLELDLDKLRKGAETDLRKTSRLEEQLRALNARVEQLTAELAASEKRANARAEAPDPETLQDLAELEALLKERAREVSRLSDDLHKTERFGRQLIVELNQLKTTSESQSQKQDLLRLAQRNAELEADLEAARWSISSLEGIVAEEKLATGPTAGRPASPSNGDLSSSGPRNSSGAD